MIKYITIANDEHTVEMSIGVDLNELDGKGDNKLFMPSIKFNCEDGKEAVYWDNEDFIFNDFKKWCEDYLNPEILAIDDNDGDFSEVIDFLDTNEKVQEILDMINQAIADEWYEDKWWKINK
jgi:hypothetical protein